ITFDHEHVPQHILNALLDAGKSVQPGPAALRLAQNKIVMREELQKLGLPMPVWTTVQDASELAAFLEAQGGRCIVKTPTGGYDGKGVRLISDAAEVADWFAASPNQPLLAEEAVDFVRELAQLSARSTSGEFRAWPLVETVQRGGVCAEVLAPAPQATAAQLAQAADIAQTVAENIGEGAGVTGVLAVELFERRNGELLINELAMRPHNSGHFTIEGSATSQFEQHLRAVLGLPLGDTTMRAPAAVMVNILGGPKSDSEHSTMASRLPDALSTPEAKVHLYGKDPRPGRKVGHVTALGSDIESARDAALRSAAAFD
ncbi:MAG: 5-(carboxyamino)imidazole ribonucleotide synthase, partial [Microbacteriaceae bacterium]